MPARSVRPPPPLSTAANEDAELRRRLILLTLARLGVAIAMLVLAMAFGGATAGSPTVRGVLAVVLGIFAVSIPYAVRLARGRNLRALAGIQIALDLAAWGALVYVTGGPNSPMSFFFGLSTLTAALVLGAGAARVTAVFAIALYGGLMVAMTSGFVHPLSDEVRRAPPSGSELALQLVTNVLGILFVTALGGSLASRLSHTGGALARAEASRDALAVLHEDVLRSIPVALLTCTIDGIIDGANPFAGALFRTDPRLLLGTPVHRWLPFLEGNLFAPGAEGRDGDATLAAIEGAPRIAYSAAPLYNQHGQARGGLVVIEDRSHAEALREVVQRTERLAVLGRLAAGLAHEIRNPLGAISGCVELVKESRTVVGEDRELLATVLREVGRLNALVTDMLTFGRPRPPERAPTDVTSLAQDVIRLAQQEQSRTRLRWNAPAETLAPLQLDAGQIRQVLWNLVRNAVQASPSDAEVDVILRATDAEVELVVADRGGGIAPELRERVFDLFYSERSRGTGLGLAIVKQIVEGHDGSVEVRGRDGGGTEFAVRLPR